MFSFVCNAQDYKLNDFKTLKVTKVSTENENFQGFLKKYTWFKTSDIESTIELNELVNSNETLLLCKFKNPIKYNFCYIMNNKKDGTYSLYFINKLQNNIFVFNEKGTLLFSSSDENGKINLKNEITIVERRNCFQFCMDYAEEQMTDDFWGSVAWNTNPAVQVVVAYGCHRICNGVPANQVF